MQICTLTQTHNHTSIPPLSFYRPLNQYCQNSDGILKYRHCTDIEAGIIIIAFCGLFVAQKKGLKNVFDEAILAALEPPEPKKRRKCRLL